MSPGSEKTTEITTVPGHVIVGGPSSGKGGSSCRGVVVAGGPLARHGGPSWQGPSWQGGLLKLKGRRHRGRRRRRRWVIAGGRRHRGPSAAGSCCAHPHAFASEGERWRWRGGSTVVAGGSWQGRRWRGRLCRGLSNTGPVVAGRRRRGRRRGPMSSGSSQGVVIGGRLKASSLGAVRRPGTVAHTPRICERGALEVAARWCVAQREAPCA